jgi:nucleoside 2-deoxyribosyltransferase
MLLHNIIRENRRVICMNNRLRNQRAYLAGAMDRVPDRGAGWRSYITPFLNEMGVVVFNPLNKPTEVGAEDLETHMMKCLMKEEGRYDELSSTMKAIRATDLRLVDISDFLVVNLDVNTHPCGTLEEIFLANRSKKPVVVHIEQGKKHAPDWLFGTLPHSMFFSCWEEVKNYLRHINEDPMIEDHGRWRFFSV